MSKQKLHFAVLRGRRVHHQRYILTHPSVFQAFDASGIMAHLAVSLNPLILWTLLILHSSQDFENTLKDVVNAKRLSQSKMNRLTEIAMKSLEVRVYMLLEDSHCRLTISELPA